MTPLEIQEMVWDAISSRELSKTGKWFLVIEKHKLRCLSPLACFEPKSKLATITEEDAQKGLTAAQWITITSRILNECKELGICPEALKP